MIKYLNKDMTISVIIPCLKKDDRTCRLIEEIKRQSNGSSIGLDLIVIEGVSPCPKARNIALKKAVGEYIAWIDSDDEIMPDWWSSIASAIPEEPDVIVFAWHDEETNRDLSYDGPTDSPNSLLHAVIQDKNPGSYLWNKVIKRKLWEGKRFDDSYRLLTDFALLPQVLKSARTIRTIKKTLYLYRYEPNSVCRGDFTGRDEQLFSILMRRVDEWRGTPFAHDALIPLAKQASYRVVKLMNRREDPATDAILRNCAEKFKKKLLFLMFYRGLWIGDKVRTMLIAIGSPRLIRFAHLIHRMFCGNEKS